LQRSYYPEFSRLLTAYLAQRDRSPTWLARRLDVSPSTVTRWLNHGTRPGNPDLVVRLADLLEVAAARETLLVAAGYGYQEAAPTPVTTPEPTNGEVTRLHEPTVPQQDTRPHNLPPQSTPFVGRAEELVIILARLHDPACRLLTLVGPGGSGKTRLALAAAEQLLTDDTDFADGIFFVPLQPATTASGTVAATAEAVGFHFYSDAPPRDQLLNYLRSKRLLLVLDNFEHLLDAAELVPAILTAAPGVKLLCTSRKALRLQEEWFHPVVGLSLPTADRSEQRTTDAVRLFGQSARRAHPAFSLQDEWEYVVRICRLVDGMPLGIELATAWRKDLTCRQIAQELENGLYILTARHRNLPARHRSMQAVLDQSWVRLTVEEQEVLARLSVLRGDFDLAAAQAVAIASPFTLAILVEKALVHARANGRYQLHELLRQYAAARLAEDAAAAADAGQRHSAYYLHFLQAREVLLLGRQQRQALDELGHEFDNIRAAWQWALAQDDLNALEPVITALYHFCKIGNRFHEGKNSLSKPLPLSSPCRIMARCRYSVTYAIVCGLV